MASQKSLVEGSEKPALTKGLLRIYSMRFCPYAQRSRLVLNHFKIHHEIVNINLKSKPTWYVGLNPNGTVPTIEHDDKVIYESLVCAEYLDSVFGDHQLLGKNPYYTAQQKMLLERFVQLIPSYYKIVLAKEEKDRHEHIIKIKSILELMEQNIEDVFFGGEKVNYLDLMIWPWIERFPVIEKLAIFPSGESARMIDPVKLPKIAKWFKSMMAHPTVIASFIATDLQIKFIEQYASGVVPNYDNGL